MGCDKAARRATSKEQARLDAVLAELAVLDQRLVAGVRGEAPRRRRLPYGRTLLKQLLCGKFGLTFLASMLRGYPCGEPLDIELGWDASTKKDTRFAREQLLA